MTSRVFSISLLLKKFTPRLRLRLRPLRPLRLRLRNLRLSRSLNQTGVLFYHYQLVFSEYDCIPG